MNRKIFFIISLTVMALNANSQTGDEWFRQKKTKLKYIEQQIVAFQMYAGYVKKGYTIIDHGWDVVDDIKHGDFDLHNNYFNSLKQVSKPVAAYYKITGITDYQLQVLQVNKKINKLAQDKCIRQQEKEYIGKVMSGLLQNCTDNISELETLVTADSLSMKESERLLNINKLYSDMQDKYSFSKHFQDDIQALILSRTKDLKEATTTKLLYELK